jgi:hypothetical protein
MVDPAVVVPVVIHVGEEARKMLGLHSIFWQKKCCTRCRYRLVILRQRSRLAMSH